MITVGENLIRGEGGKRGGKRSKSGSGPEDENLKYESVRLIEHFPNEFPTGDDNERVSRLVQYLVKMI